MDDNGICVTSIVYVGLRFSLSKKDKTLENKCYNILDRSKTKRKRSTLKQIFGERGKKTQREKLKDQLFLFAEVFGPLFGCSAPIGATGEPFKLLDEMEN